MYNLVDLEMFKKCQDTECDKCKLLDIEDGGCNMDPKMGETELVNTAIEFALGINQAKSTFKDLLSSGNVSACKSEINKWIERWGNA
jgi:hypothetical protein